MSRARLVLLSLVAVMSVGAMAASAASAAINFEWRVAGAKLEPGHSVEFTVNNDSKKFDLHGTVAGAASLLLSTAVAVLPGANIKGGIPGTNEEIAVFSGVTVDNPANCGVLQAGGSAGVVQTVPLKTEIVEGAVAGVGNNEVDILFIPKTGTTFATFELTGASCLLKTQIAPVSGSVLALALPQKSEVLKQNLVFEANTKEYHNSAGEFKKAGLLFAGNTATLEGLVLVILNSDQVFGPF